MHGEIIVDETLILFQLSIERQPSGTDWPPVPAEFIRGIPIGDGIYTIRKPPIFAESLNVFDAVRAEMRGVPEQLTFSGIQKASGYHTIRVRPNTQSKELLVAGMETLRLLEEAGCVAAQDERFEILALGIPPKAVLSARLILAAEIEGAWECNAFDRERIFVEMHLGE